MNITLIRHAQAQHNVEKARIAGRMLNSPLTKLGISSTTTLAKSYKANKIGFDIIYHSPALRCIETAKIIAEHQVVMPKFVEHDLLLEMDQGTHVGKLKIWTILNPANLLKLVVKGKNFSFINGETFNQVGIRMQSALDDIKKSDGKNVLVVTHGLAMRCLDATQNDSSVWQILLSSNENLQTKKIK